MSITPLKSCDINPENIYQLTSYPSLPLPFYSSKVQAGFPSPADDHLEGYLDLNDYLVSHPEATFFVRATGDSMEPAGIQSGDLLIVDRSLTPRHDDLVVAAVEDLLTVKRLYHKKGKIMLVADNPNYPPIVLKETLELVIWGVVIHIIHSLRK